MSAMRILVTGGAGCLGSSLAEHWLASGHTLFVLDNFATGSPEALPASPGVVLREGTVADADLVEDCFRRFEPTHVVHAAASYKDPSNWQEDAATNVLGAVNVARAALRFGAKRMVNLQTALCYGRPTQMPIPVTHPTAPTSSYGISKTAGEAYLLASCVPVVSLRLANVCGPRLAIGPIPTFYKRLKAGADCFCSDTIRDFLDMADFLELMDSAMQVNAPTGVFHGSTGEGRSIRAVYDLVAAHLGIEARDVRVVPPGEDDVPAVVLDPSETERRLGWRARVGFEDTIARQLRWYDANGVGKIRSHLATPGSK